MAFAFIVAVSLPQAFLALPIVVAGVGPLVGMALGALLGLMTTMTVACMAEAVACNWAICYGSAFIGRIATDYLGRTGSSVLTLARATLFFLALRVSYFGLATTLANFTTVPSPMWVVVLLVAGLYLLSRPSFSLRISL